MIRRFFSLTNTFKTAGWTSPELEHSGKPEDAYSLTPRLITLCDGQSKWRTQGIDPGLHAWELASNIVKAQNSLPEGNNYDPLHILSAANAMTNTPGSSTCILALIHPEKNLVFTGWVGDSGLVLLRKEGNDVKIVKECEEFGEKFDFPFDLGIGGIEPSDAQVKTLEVKDKDVILLFSDGVSHNLTMESVLKTIKPFMLLHEIPDLEIVAEMITEKAQSVFMDEKAEKPFGVKTGNKLKGKNNDATIVIAEVCLRNIEV
jgi:serine/threonine protein phosphatase PrpC